MLKVTLHAHLKKFGGKSESTRRKARKSLKKRQSFEKGFYNCKDIECFDVVKKQRRSQPAGLFTLCKVFFSFK